MAGTPSGGSVERPQPSTDNSGAPDQPLSRPGTGPLGGDKVDEYSDQSFPASDPPAWTSESGVGAPPPEPATDDKGQ